MNQAMLPGLIDEPLTKMVRLDDVFDLKEGCNVKDVTSLRKPSQSCSGSWQARSARLASGAIIRT